LQKGGSGRRRAGQISSFDAGRYRRRAKTTYPGRTDLGLESPSYKNSCPFVSIRGSIRQHSQRPFRTDLGLESPSYMKFVSIRVHSWFNTTTLAKTLQGRSRAGKPELHEIRVHSCPFVVQNDPQRRPCRTDLGLESTSYKNSCPFVSIRGSKRPSAKTLQDRSRAGKPELQKFVPIRAHSWFKNAPQRSPFRTDLGLTPELRRGVLGGRGNSPTTSVGFPPAFAVHSAAASHRGARTVLHSRFCRNPT